MITLGLVDSVDDNGVYVTMPGSRGVLRGPYRAMQTVGAGARVLLTTTDDGEVIVTGGVPGPDGVFNVRHFGAVGDGSTSDTTAIRAAAAALSAAGSGVLLFPAGNYLVGGVSDGGSLVSFQGLSGVHVDASQATITNLTSYTADTFSTMFLFDDCSEVTVKIRDYVGYELPDVTLGSQRGATVVRLKNGCRGVKVDARLTNARYGVQAGNYFEESEGGNNNLSLRVRATRVGYPVALYLSDDVEVHVDADEAHRAGYFAGVRGLRGEVFWADQYLADVVVLLTDARISDSESRGCSNVDLASIDKGSTIFTNTAACVGIVPSRVQPLVYENIRLRFHVQSSDTLSTQVGGFKLYSSAKDYASDYTTPAQDWDPDMVFRNITVSGLIEHTGQTANGNDGGDIFIRTYDATDDPTAANPATVENLTLEDISIPVRAPGTARLGVRVPDVTNLTLRNVYTPGNDYNLVGSTTDPVVFDNCTAQYIYMDSGVPGGATKVDIRDSTISRLYDPSGSDWGDIDVDHLFNSRVGGVGPMVRQRRKVVTLTGASVTWSSAIPAGALLLSVQGYLRGTITSATGYQVGVSGDTDRFADRNETAPGSIVGPTTLASDALMPQFYTAATDLLVTAKTSNFANSATLRLLVTYLDFGTVTDASS